MARRFETGCLPLTREQKSDLAAVVALAPSIADYSWTIQGDMPILKWDADFTERLEERSELREKYERAGYSLYPWDILGVLPAAAKGSGLYCWNQGPLPSCSMTGAAHAYQSAELVSIALGAPLRYEAFNPVYPFYFAKHGSLAGGLTLYETAEYCNLEGFLPVSIVGDDNTHVDRDNFQYRGEGKKWQSGVVYIEGDLVENIVSACRGLYSVCFGSGCYYTDSAKDSRGVKVMTGRSFGGHAQCFTGYKNVDGEEYVFNLNSHGDIYTAAEDGTPYSGAWVTRRHLEVYARDMENYGLPFIALPEGEFRREDALANDFVLPKLRKA